MFTTNDVMHVLKLFASSSLHVNFASTIVTLLFSIYLKLRSLFILVFLVLVSLKAGSTPIEFIAASA